MQIPETEMGMVTVRVTETETETVTGMPADMGAMGTGLQEIDRAPCCVGDPSLPRHAHPDCQ